MTQMLRTAKGHDMSLIQRVRAYLETRPEGRCDRCIVTGLDIGGPNAITRVNQSTRRLAIRSGFRRARAWCPGCKRPRLVTALPR